MLIVLPVVALAGLVVGLRGYQPTWGLRRTVLRSIMLFGAFSILSVELLSILRLLTRFSLGLLWATAAGGLMVWASRARERAHSSPRPIRPQLRVTDTVHLLGLTAVLALTGLVAVLAPPNTWDSLTYHMARVAHWSQNRSVWPYATGNEVQNGSSPGAEMILLHLYVLAGGDEWVNLVEWFAMAGSLVGVSLVIRQLGGNARSQAAGALIAATLPMGILQATSTMNDYVVTLWLVCVASECLLLSKQPERRDPALYLALAAGLAISTKQVAYPYLLPFGILSLAIWIRSRHKRAYRVMSAGLILVFALNIGHLSRNLLLFGNPFGASRLYSGYPNQERSWRGLVSNVVRNAGLHAGTPWEIVNVVLLKGVIKIHLLMDLALDDPRTTWNGEFGIRAPPVMDETMAGNNLHAWLYLIGFPLALLSVRRFGTWPLVFLAAVVAGFAAFSYLFKWEIFGSRFHLPLFVLYAPILALTLQYPLNHRITVAVGLATLILSWPWLLQNPYRPLLPIPGRTEAASLLLESRERFYFGSDALYSASSAVTERIVEASCDRVGIMLGGNEPEYSWWVLLGAPWRDLRVEWIAAGTPSERYRDPNFQACAVICDTTCPHDWLAVGELPLVLDQEGFRLYLASARSPTSAEQ